jgi:thiol-disulfide isomerase/thioredoxin
VPSLSRLKLLIMATALCAARASVALDGLANAPRTPRQILADVAATPLPAIDVPATADPAYSKEITARRDAARQKRAALAVELYKAAPAAPEVPALLAERWETLAQAGSADAALSEMDDYLRGGLAAREKVSASYLRARIRIQYQAKDTTARLAAIDEFKAAVGEQDARSMVPQLLYTAGRLASDAAEKERLLARVVAEYPDSAAAKVVRGIGRKSAAVGATMELTFKDAITGKRIDLADFRGQVVVVDFWAAWCTDCAAEMPYMKRVYADVKGKGVQFIGVSLDVPEEEGGLRALKESVARFGIDWPQYYPGGKWDSEFSSTWGVFAVPTVFVLDRKGVIVSTDARGKLETLLPKLLEHSEP